MEPAREQRLLDHLAILMAGCGVPIFVLGKILGSFYGRYSKGSSHCEVPARLAWVLQELPSLVVPLWCARAGGGHLHCWPNWILLAMFVAHYVQRSVQITRARPASRRPLQHQPGLPHRPLRLRLLKATRDPSPHRDPLPCLPPEPESPLPHLFFSFLCSPWPSFQVPQRLSSLCAPTQDPNPVLSLHLPSWIRGIA